jgi:hypothetical protein
MADLLADYLLLAWVLMSVGAIGLALCQRFTRFVGIELVGYGLAAGVVSHGVCGLLLVLSPRQLRPFFFLLPVGCAVVSIIYLSKRRVWPQLLLALTRQIRICLLIWFLFLACCIALIHLEVRFPASLQDGMYVFKKHTLNVKIQFLTSLPADNYIPYAVTECLLRNVSFQRERPLLPGNEVSNRTILMSLVAVPFRAALSWPDYGTNQLGRFDYLGKTWPDVGKLYEEASFRQFLVVGIFLNSLLLVGLIVLFSNFPSPKGLVIASVLFVTNLYVIDHTIFTWPKSMAGFFILLCWNGLRRNHNAKLVGLCAAVAFHCHPSSIVAAVSIGLWYAFQAWRSKSSFKPLFEFALVFVIVLLPWIIWTRMILGIPSDMIAQNFSGPGTEAAMASPIDFIWIRFKNALDTFAPVPFSIYPFQLTAVVNYATFCLPFVAGIFLIVPSILEAARLRQEERMLVWHGMVIPATTILALYSYPEAVVVVHGWQPIVGMLTFLGVLRLRRNFSPFAFAALVTLQLLCNLWIVVSRGVLVGAHFS